MPSAEEYEAFLHRYLAAAEENPVLGRKDNLLNSVLHAGGGEPFGGCTGFGCGAAFNFVSLLPDGKVHACRKFPSLLGNLHDHSLRQIYDSEPAERYRLGSQACRGCVLRPACGGCLASAFGFGLDVFEQRDPFCRLDPS